VWIAGEADGRDPGGALMNQDAEEKEMQYGGGNAILRVVCGRFDGFAYGLDAFFS